MAAEELVHEIVAEPEPVTLPGIIEPHTSPVGALSVRVTSPLKLLSAATVMVGTEDCPTSTGDGWEIVIEKSGKARTVTLTTVEWVMVPFVAVTVTV